MSATLQFDEDAFRRVEEIYTTPDVIQQRQAILRALVLQPGPHWQARLLRRGLGPDLQEFSILWRERAQTDRSR